MVVVFHRSRRKGIVEETGSNRFTSAVSICLKYRPLAWATARSISLGPERTRGDRQVQCVSRVQSIIESSKDEGPGWLVGWLVWLILYLREAGDSSPCPQRQVWL